MTNAMIDIEGTSAQIGGYARVLSHVGSHAM
jgi:hypothetical protein